jgi:hypothetical protein
MQPVAVASCLPLFIDPKARATQPQRREHQWNAYVCRWGRKKAPVIESAMPAGGTIAAAYCFERKCRHIPLESQRADAVVEPSKRYHIRSPACLKDQTSQFVQSIRSAYAQEVI